MNERIAGSSVGFESGLCSGGSRNPRPVVLVALLDQPEHETADVDRVELTPVVAQAGRDLGHARRETGRELLALQPHPEPADPAVAIGRRHATQEFGDGQAIRFSPNLLEQGSFPRTDRGRVRSVPVNVPVHVPITFSATFPPKAIKRPPRAFCGPFAGLSAPFAQSIVVAELLLEEFPLPPPA